MLRNEIQKLTGLTRKSIEYYEENDNVIQDRLALLFVSSTRWQISLPLLFEKVKSALVWILLILNTMINSLDFTNSKDCFYSYGLY